ncbi:alpha/beta hydrolase [Shinella daejeonensis]|uniref:alpha/beta fold hydrolase n=1 Tax=Shinella daejeonensis TaxID=659017 RepID=UPI0020C811D8|nr:alpha/beta fold hydrolase [Shinella daejeonensis]MCP8896254.1 alpha/beta hydrolase [Shinella daejeonensis]
MPKTLPIAFGGCAGHLTLPVDQAPRTTGVVLCRSWGFDELCTRKFLRLLAEALAEAGFAVLRFDYPGTVDSLDGPDGGGLAAWTDAADAACDRLRALSGCDRVALFGLGTGALVADTLAARREDAAGLILAAPVVNGRKLLRETGIRAKVVLAGLGLADDPDLKGQVTIGGLVLAPDVAEALKTARLDGNGPGRIIPHLVVAREAVATDRELADQRAAAGHPVTTQPFDGYDKLMENPTASRVRRSVIEGIAAFATDAFPETMNGPMPAVRNPETRITGAEFQEEGVVFRPEAPLFGILCRPVSTGAAAADRSVALLLNSGYDHHGGWARSGVAIARDLARLGIPSLRFDFSNIGDSPAVAGDPEQVLYTEGPIRDVSAALDHLAVVCPGYPVVVGRCSGAYTALHAAVRDPRIRAVALVNQLRLIWDPAESLDDVSRMGPRSVGEYSRRLRDAETFRRLLKGQVNVRAVLRGFAQHAVTRVSHGLAPFFPGISKYARFRAECHRMFRELDRRAIPVFMLSSEGDESLEQIALYFGRKRQGLRAFRHVRLETIAQADHNMTPLAAQAALRQKLCAALSSL